MRKRSKLTDEGSTRDGRAVRWLSGLGQDVRYGLRGFGRAPGFTAVVVLTLALGIGATSSIFALVDSILLRPLAYAEPERLMAVWERAPDGNARNTVSPANFVAWRERSRAFEALAASSSQPVVLTGNEPEEVRALLTSADYLALLGVQARLGRTYLPGEHAEDRVVVLSYALWQRRFGGDPGVLGRVVHANGSSLMVIGVLPPDARAPGQAADVWVPVDVSKTDRRRELRVVGRLRPGVTLERAREDMEAIARQTAAEAPAFNTGWGVSVVPLRADVTGEVRTPLLVLLGCVGLLLLIACANVANLLLARMTARGSEVALRASLGASRGRLVRQMLVESTLLALAGCAPGLLVAAWSTKLGATRLAAVAPLPRMDEVALHPRVLAGTVALLIPSVLVFGVLPALVETPASPWTRLRGEGSGVVRGRSRVRTALVLAELALALTLLVGAGLLIRSLDTLLRTDDGVRTESVLTLRMTFVPPRYRMVDSLAPSVERLIERMESVPGVVAVGAIGSLPFSGVTSSTGFYRADRPRPAEGEEPSVDLRVIAGEYHRVLWIPLLRGRRLGPQDRRGAPTAYVINDALARRFFPGEDPVGKRIALRRGEWNEGEVVGVVGSVRESGPAREPAPAVYVAYGQRPEASVAVVVRAAVEPASLERAVKVAIRELDPGQSVTDVRTMEQVAAEAVERPKLHAALLGGFAAAALLLAGLGLYGVVAYWVRLRRAELGVRVALGARPWDLLRLVIGEALRLTAAGAAAGLVMAVALSRLLRSLLVGVSPSDPLTLAAAAAFLFAVAVLASWLPARRAARIDPMAALRHE